MDIFATGKAIDLYREELKRRIDELEKKIAEKDKTIEKHTRREVLYLTSLASLIVALYLVHLFG
jgi:hypothetical protein